MYKMEHFVTGQKYPYTLTTEEIHKATKTKPINITLHAQEAKTWTPLHLDDHYIYKNLIHAQINIERYNKFFSEQFI